MEATSNDATRPEPPDEPLIEEYDEEDEESTNVAGENDPVIEYTGEKGGAGRVAPGPVHTEHRPPRPVILEPARPPAVVLKAKTKNVSRPPARADVRDRPEGSTSAASTSDIAPKARPTTSETHSSGTRVATSTPRRIDDQSNQTPESTNAGTSRREVPRIDLTAQTSGAAESFSEDYTGSLTDVRDTALDVDPQTPTSTSVKGVGKGGWGRRHQQSQQQWRPRGRENPSAASSSTPPWRSHQSQARRVVRNRVRWGAWNELWRRNPNAEGDDDFWYDPPSGEWFVKEYV